ncbi:MAG: cysteine desulfurase [Patescibacteria group bacterium]|nr:cysteine desulfurase [Patescibacteria group bacterium]MDD5715739.1 cysteine desulfurase [Patescibacteria group bacterium]
MVFKNKKLSAACIRDFPILKKRVHGKRFVFLDSAASTQKPQAVIDAMSACYKNYYANVHRGIYQFSERASEAYEEVREKVRSFINAGSTREIIFTRNATESINLVAYSWGKANIRKGDEILITEMEHHANLVPWQELAKEHGAKVRYVPITGRGRLDLDAFESMISVKTKIVAFAHVSNVLGTINPAAKLVQIARKKSPAIVLVDGAQSVPHLPVDVQAIGADFYVFSAHKMLGPSGVGVLHGREEILSEMRPFMTGGDMISKVTFEGAQWNDLPWKFEAGTPDIAGVIGFGAALDYLSAFGMKTVQAYEEKLTARALPALLAIPGVEVYGPKETRDRSSAIAFSVGDAHPHDIASIFDEEGIAIRAGDHCAQPLHEKLGVPATARASFYLYNTPADIEALIRGVYKVKKIFRV